jgi:hypothetical protein
MLSLAKTMTLSLAKRLPGVNAFEISDIREEEIEAAVIRLRM